MKEQKPSWSVLIRLKSFYAVVILYFLLVGYAVGLGIGGLWVLGIFRQYTGSRETVRGLQGTVERVQNNKVILESSIDQYNASLDQLIPSQESYFAVVSALERWVQKTGVTMSSYNLDVGETNENTLTLQVQIEGKPERLQDFFDKSLYAGGRLITIGHAVLLDREKGKMLIDVTFYHDSSSVAKDVSVGKISPEQIKSITILHERLQE